MKFKEGSSVEIFKRSDDQYGRWFPAIVLSRNKHKYTVRYMLHLTDQAKHVVETVNDEDVRPKPPPVNGKVSWIAGDVVEVFDQDSWRAGKIVKVLKNGSVMKLFGSIQLKEFHITNLRNQQDWRENQWIITNKKICEQVAYDYGTKDEGLLASRQNPALGREYCTIKSSKQSHLDSSSPVATKKRDLNTYYGLDPDDAVKGTLKRTKGNSKGEGSHPVEKSALPKKVDAISFPKVSVAEKFLHMSSKGPKVKNGYIKNNKSSTNNFNLDNQAGHSHAKAMQVSEENIVCSVASCSANQCHGYTNFKNRHQLKSTGSKILDDAMSSCPSDNRNDNQSLAAEEFAASIHELELHAYQTTMQALYASGPLSWEQESLLTNLRLCLNISNEEHLLHLRHLMAA